MIGRVISRARHVLARLVGGATHGLIRETESDPNERRVEEQRSKGSKIGENTRIYGTLDGVNPHLITVGSHCVVGVSAALLTHCPIRGPMPVSIGDHVWIGFNGLVLPGVEIGSVSIVGAGSVVTKSFPPRSIIAGNPARRLRALTEEEATSLMSRLESGEKIGFDHRAHA